jgi:cell division protein FtsB
MTTKNLIQAYQQAPWRAQLQYIGLFLLGLVVVALVGGVYLYISAETVSAGVSIQDLEVEKADMRREIADLESQIANLQASALMEKRAKDLGYQRIDPAKVVYMSIPGYAGRQSVHLAPKKIDEPVAMVVIKDSYTQSLWEWFNASLMDMSDRPMGNSK